jgi:hypothetical protein
MTNIYRGDDVRLIQLGRLVTRATKVIPQATSESLFTVTGGNILLTGILGEVTTAMDAVATTLKLIHTPSAAGTAATDLSGASADITGAIVGTLFAIPAAKATGLIVSATAGNFASDVCPQWLLPPGAIGLTGTGLNTGGRIKWQMSFIPLDDAAAVAAA